MLGRRSSIESENQNEHRITETGIDDKQMQAGYNTTVSNIEVDATLGNFTSGVAVPINDEFQTPKPRFAGSKSRSLAQSSADDDDEQRLRNAPQVKFGGGEPV